MFSASKTAAPVSGAYQISNSVRLRSAASAYFNRTPSVAGNRQTWTWSGWVKRGASGSRVTLFSAGVGSGSRYAELDFENNDTIFWNAGDYTTGGSTTLNSQLGTSAVYRDFSAWYHIVFVYDTTQATASNRIKLYVNGVQVTSLAIATYPSQNSSTFVNAANAHGIANFWGNAGTQQFDGYLADINFIDGQALTPSSFGQINPTTGVWQPARYTGSYGTNGFHLAFNNGTSTTTLGNDSSGNGNNWTPNNISLTAGSTYDWMLDSPTPYAGTSYGVGNYAVLNPLSPAAALANATLSDGNLSITGGPSGNTWRPSTISVSSGKWYFETTIITVGTISVVGLNNVTLQPFDGYVGDSPLGYGYLLNGNKQNNNVASGYGAAYTSGDIIGVAFDADAGSLTFYKNGTSQGMAYSSIPAGSYCFNVYGRISGSPNNCAANFGQRPFAYTPPSGYKTLCTQNLPKPTIQNGAAHMAATLYTGTLLSNAVSNAVNSVSFKPDFVWIKSRSAATDHKLTDSVRGTTKALVSDSTAAETTDSQGLTTFGPSGFTVGTDIVYNNLAATYVAWQWKAGGTAVTNTAGSITSQVSANTTAGFSVVTFTAQSSGTGTVGHGLGVVPSMIIIKSRNNVSGWPVYHISTGNTGYINLTTTGAFVTDSTVWNNTSPTSSMFQSGSVWTGLTQNIVAYCFAAIAGYSAFGSYTGNGSTDGVFVYCGFQPKFVLIKCSSTTGNWYIFDSARNTYNVLGEQLYPNLSNAGSTVTTLDILSNGFKMRISTDPNASATYVYAAFASSPFQNSLAF